MSGYYLLGFYQMQDSVLNQDDFMAKSCGDDIPISAPDFFVCEKGSCQFKDNTLIMSIRGGNVTTAQIVDRQWRFGQPILYIRMNE